MVDYPYYIKNLFCRSCRTCKEMNLFPPQERNEGKSNLCWDCLKPKDNEDIERKRVEDIKRLDRLNAPLSKQYICQNKNKTT